MFLWNTATTPLAAKQTVVIVLVSKSMNLLSELCHVSLPLLLLLKELDLLEDSDPVYKLVGPALVTQVPGLCNPFCVYDEKERPLKRTCTK